MCPKSHEHSCDNHGEAASITEEKKCADYSCPISFPESPHQTTVITMPERSVPNFLYKRRKLRGEPVTFLSGQAPASATRSGEDCLSVISSDAPSVAFKEQHVVSQDKHETEAVGAPVVPPLVCNGEPHILKSESSNRFPFVEDLDSDEAFKNSRQKMIEVDSINDSCSSSKSNADLISASMKTEVDDAGECSSSGVMVREVMGEDLWEKDLCISMLTRQGVFETVGPRRTHASTEGVDDCGGCSGSRACKICNLAESSLKMLICDSCEEAFHVSCWNLRVKRIPSDEWFCHSCLKKKRKILKDTISRKSPNLIVEMGRCRNASSADESNPIALMLRDTEPYTTGVRVGKGFQTEVPDWSGPINNDVDSIGEPLEMDPSDFVSMHELKSNKPSKLGSIGNWLQCREVIDAGETGNGTICGKWRRAPLFEVQSDNWECFCSIFWDPIHADCAVPQELETDEVLKQLKYIQMLRPRLAAKRQKLDRTNNVDSLDKTKE